MRTSAIALGIVAAAVSVQAGDLRLFNPNAAAVAATVVCDNVTFTSTVAPHGINDVYADGCIPPSASPLLVLETGTRDDGVEWQRLVGGSAAAECPSTIPLMIARSGCRFGTAVVAVDPIADASYSWSIDGGSLLSGAGTERITIALGGGDALKIDVIVATPGCTRSGAGVMALHDAFLVAQIDPGNGFLGQSRTITWSYANGTPATQTLSGSDFAPIALPPAARSYTYVPLTEGDKSIAIDARSGPMPPGGRQRAAGRGTAAASDCNVARGTAAYRVTCIAPEAIIIAPAATNIEASFTARVDLPTGATAKWTIANGTPSTATGAAVVIKPTGPAPVDISVTVTLGSCSNSGSKRVAVDGTFACDNPSVEVAILRNDCSDAVVQARFIGKAPFRGTWNDGVQFMTSDRAVERSVPAGGTFSVVTFQDAICAGAKSNSVTVTPKISSATLSTSGGSCAGSAWVVATFTGVPPFSGTWSDGTSFSTSSNQINKPVMVGGPISLEFRDAICPTKSVGPLQFIEPGTLVVSLDKTSGQSCVTRATIDADISGGAPPYSVTWSDGSTTATPTGSATAHLTHSFNVYPPSGTFGVTSAHDSRCALKLAPPPTITFTAEAPATFYTAASTCANQTGSAQLYYSPGSGTTVDWSLTNGTITSGQGTSTVRFVGTPGTTGVLVCHTTTSTGCTDAASANIAFLAPPAVPQLSLAPGASVPVGTAVSIAWTVDSNTSYSTIDANTPGNQPSPTYCYGKTCSSSYTAKAAGSVKLTVHAYGKCGELINGSATLTVTP